MSPVAPSAQAPDSAALDRVPAGALNKVASGLGSLTYLRRKGGAWDLSAPLAQALDLRAEAASRGLPLDDLLRQESLLGPRLLDPTPTTPMKRLARQLRGDSSSRCPTRG